MIIQLIDPINHNLVCEDTYESFIENNAEDEEVIEALKTLDQQRNKQTLVPSFQGYMLLRVKPNTKERK